MNNVISLELNELNFEFIQRYIAAGKLPNFARLLERYTLFETVAESGYPDLEPWIQWPTVYTGKAFADHGVFRLGDIVGSGHEQIWELLEKRGVSVGAISPMNAENRCRHADFFVPDPWTVTQVTGDAGLQELAGLIAAAVNGNATPGSGPGDGKIARKLAPYLLRYSRMLAYPQYLHVLWYARRYKWAKAAFLDRFLADLFMKQRRQHGTQFASLFLNAGAHIQHHHMFESDVYEGEQENPAWYSTAKMDGVDPLLFIYDLYDHVLGDMLALPDTRLLVTTGLSQKPNAHTIYQYRFNRHADTLARLGVTDFEVVPRMSRDFLLTFEDDEATKRAARRMAQVRCRENPLFTVEERNRSLFCQIAYFGPSDGLREVIVDGQTQDLEQAVSLVSIENGIHRTIGYHIDTGILAGERGANPQIPLTEVFHQMLACFPADTKALSLAA